jgi:DNA ligase-associated metallophosphoesterase
MSNKAETQPRSAHPHAPYGAGCVGLVVEDERLILLPTRAIYWPGKQTLIVADTHWGKSAAMRRAGIPVPAATASDDLARLTESIQRTGAQRVVLLGDLLHSRDGRQPSMLGEVRAWRQMHGEIPFLLIRGNHDRHAGDPPAAWDIASEDEPVADAPFVFRHTPKPSNHGYVLAGHVHPAVRLRGNGAQRLRLPCFHFASSMGTLPAFSGLATGAEIRPATGDRVFVVADDEVIEKTGSPP